MRLPAAAVHVARRLFRAFVADGVPTPPGLLEPLARAMRADGDVDVARTPSSSLFFSSATGPVDSMPPITRGFRPAPPRGPIGGRDILRHRSPASRITGFRRESRALGQAVPGDDLAREIRRRSDHAIAQAKRLEAASRSLPRLVTGTLEERLTTIRVLIEHDPGLRVFYTSTAPAGFDTHAAQTSRIASCCGRFLLRWPDS